MPKNPLYVKTISYSIMHMLVAFVVALALTQDWRIALGISLIEPAAQTVAYFYHEKFWHRYHLKHRQHDVHNSVTESCSPFTRLLHPLLRHRRSKPK